MIYWYTGQPGHGKTLHAIQRLLEFKAKGRLVYACNIRGFDYEKTGVNPMTPDQFRDWMNFLPDGAVALVDEAYEHDMLPKRAAASKVPAHVEQLAKHRHRGLDFIFVCQSPDTQCDQFVRDLIERHIHVRRRFGTQWVHLREFDRFERQPEKSTPLTIKRHKLPKAIFGTYQSTELDTTERRIPWFYFAFAIGVPAAIGMMYYTFGDMGSRLGGGNDERVSAVNEQTATGNGATATVPARVAISTPEEYRQQFEPRVPEQPWSAPIYDSAFSLPSEPPRLLCVSADEWVNAYGETEERSCNCYTEQGTPYPYDVTFDQCMAISLQGQYEPYYKRKDATIARYSGSEQQKRLIDSLEDRAREDEASVGEGGQSAAAKPSTGVFRPGI